VSFTASQGSLFEKGLSFLKLSAIEELDVTALTELSRLIFCTTNITEIINYENLKAHRYDAKLNAKLQAATL